ncbi:acyl-CoA dehydrogenase family protein [Sphingorhabdus sp. EL138]|uniref:acyl-CoA dehydrogenase family protein n=1 Tax=Sphingorhabdus sp. EL138 TaxID=2073156 RepID=UPI000D69E5F9|nr:acyl-CoA dehydrogenase family protein [Sphingorhabdus sp. EL138]
MTICDRNSSPEEIENAVDTWLDAHWDSDRRCAKGDSSYDEATWLKTVFEAGFCVPTWPTEWFGLGLRQKQARIIEKAFAKCKAPGHSRDRFHLGAITVFKVGSDELKRAMLPTLLTGPICCLLYSEPNAGSDLAGVRTKAIPDGDEFVITGQKIWTSNAQEAEYGMLLSRTDWDVPKHRGITFFLFPMKQDGVEVKPINQITGESEFNEVFITEARVPASHIIGNLNEGWTSFQTAIAYERLIMGQGITERQGKSKADSEPQLIRLARKYDKYDDPAVRQKIAQALAYRELNNLNMERAKEEILKNGSSSLMSLGKLAMSRIQHGEAAIATDLMGNEALLDGEESLDAANVNFDAAKAYMNSIGGGTDQIQKNIIAERVLNLPKGPDLDRNTAFRDVKSS